MKSCWLGLVALAAVMTGCASGGTSEKAPDAAAKGTETSEFKVALLTPGPVSDAGWSAMAYEGLQQIKTEMGASVDNQEASGTQIRDAMRAYAQKNYNLVFGHGFEYNKPGVEISKDFPKTVFISSSGGETSANAGAFRFYLEQGTYLAGVYAAKMSKTGTIGSVAIGEIPSIVSTLKAFEAGAKSVNPNIKIIPTVYFGDDKNPANAKRATEGVIAQGADFVIHQANAAAQAVFTACKEKGVNAIGTNADQNGEDAVAGSAVIIAGPAFLDLAKKVKDGTYRGGIELMGMEQGAIDFVISPKVEAKVPEDVKKLIADTKEAIKSGKLKVPKDEF